MGNTLRWKNATDNTEFLIEYDDRHLVSITVYPEGEHKQPFTISTKSITVLPNKYYFGIVGRRETFFLHITQDRHKACISAPHHNFLNFAGVDPCQEGTINSIFNPHLEVTTEAHTNTIENSSQNVRPSLKVCH